MGRLLVIGCGGHGRIVAEAAQQSGEFEVVGFADDDHLRHGETVGRWKVLGSWQEIDAEFVVVAIGKNEARKRVFLAIAERNLATVISPRAFVSDMAQVGEGTVVLAGAVIQAGARVGKNVIINAGAVVDHDAEVGDHSQVGANATVGSFGRVAECEIVLAGAVRFKAIDC